MSTVQSVFRWQILLILFLSSIGTTLFMAGIPLYLLGLGMATVEVTTLLALTAVPNMLFGWVLGRLVDNSDRRFLYLSLSIGLALLELVIVFLLPALDGKMQIVLAFIVMQVFAFCYSPLSTLTYQYLVPSLHPDETKIYAIWEFTIAAAAALAALFIYIFLSSFSLQYLVIVDAVSFLVAGIAVWVLWRDPLQPRQASDVLCRPDRSSAFRLILADPILLAAGSAMIVVAFTIHAVEDNAALIMYRELQLGDAVAASIAASLGAVAAVAAWGVQRHSHLVASALGVLHQFCLLAYFVVALILGFALHAKLTSLAVCAVLLGAMVEPVWSVVNNRLLRSRAPAGRYGEIHGLLRMPRAMATILGAWLVGWSQGIGHLSIFSLAAAAILLITCLTLFGAQARQQK